jgi:Cof subfamily protein (haloacid dehalogenase superfamily)
MIKLLALDLDGTLLGSDGLITARNRKAIVAAENSGVLVTIATGRRFRDARPVALDLQLNAPVICHNGALVKYADTLETVSASILSPVTIRQILETGLLFGADAMLSCDPGGKGILFYEHVSDVNIPLRKYLEWSAGLHGSEAGNAVVKVPSLAAVAEIAKTVHTTFSGPCALMTELQAALKEKLADTATILATAYPARNFTIVDVLPPDASKGIGLRKLADLHGIEARDVMAMGDNFNDLEMLEFAGTPVVMGNADSSVINRDGFAVTAPNDEDGVALAIEKFILN